MNSRADRSSPPPPPSSRAWETLCAPRPNAGKLPQVKDGTDRLLPEDRTAELDPISNPHGKARTLASTSRQLAFGLSALRLWEEGAGKQGVLYKWWIRTWLCAYEKTNHSLQTFVRRRHLTPLSSLLEKMQDSVSKGFTEIKRQASRHFSPDLAFLWLYMEETEEDRNVRGSGN
ncbi:hypothetical protein SKAU_G00290330 [Synaphobranchus kaupii]|uniref:Uncharacterized protein n=1 Tax=Synaphobranchus kaupii TaxID=118154 RepID=A0A9Q1ETP1_SYNKA|nr:hypothetical protein SKAU_G00290330 [Synaphobranchus kaupii]